MKSYFYRHSFRTHVVCRNQLYSLERIRSLVKCGEKQEKRKTKSYERATRRTTTTAERKGREYFQRLHIVLLTASDDIESCGDFIWLTQRSCAYTLQTQHSFFREKSRLQACRIIPFEEYTERNDFDRNKSRENKCVSILNQYLLKKNDRFVTIAN